MVKAKQLAIAKPGAGDAGTREAEAGGRAIVRLEGTFGPTGDRSMEERTKAMDMMRRRTPNNNQKKY